MKWFLIPFLLLSGTPVSAGEVSMTGSCASSVSEVEISSTGDIKVGKMRPGRTGEFDTKVKNKTFTYE